MNVAVGTAFRRALRPQTPLRVIACVSSNSTRAFALPKRSIHATAKRNGTTTLPNILAGGPAPPVIVKSMDSNGLQLADGLTIPGACIFLEGEVFLWDIPPAETWNKMSAAEVQERFELFEVVVPKPGMHYLISII
jgi:NADH dehydrogenase [ubiquinone] 1 alpha subcomplex assembly factor 3